MKLISNFGLRTCEFNTTRYGLRNVQGPRSNGQSRTLRAGGRHRTFVLASSRTVLGVEVRAGFRPLTYIARSAMPEGLIAPNSLAGRTQDHDGLGGSWARQGITALDASATPGADAWATVSTSGREALPPDSLFQLLDAGLERGRLALQFFQRPFPDCAPPSRTAAQVLHPAEPRPPRRLLRLPSFQTAVDLVAMIVELSDPLGGLPTLGLTAIAAGVAGFEPAVTLRDLPAQAADALLGCVLGPWSVSPGPTPRRPKAASGLNAGTPGRASIATCGWRHFEVKGTHPSVRMSGGGVRMCLAPPGRRLRPRTFTRSCGSFRLPPSALRLGKIPHSAPRSRQSGGTFVHSYIRTLFAA